MTEEQLELKMKQILEDYAPILNMKTVEGESEDVIQDDEELHKTKKISNLN